MDDATKTKSQLIEELARLRGRVSELEETKENLKRKKQALHESVKSYQSLMEHVTEVIWTMDLDFNFTYVSPSVEQLFGYTVAEALSKRLEEIFPPNSLNDLLDGIRFAVENSGGLDFPSPPFTYEIQFYKSDGSLTWAEVAVSYLTKPDTGEIYVQGVTRDITERKSAEQALRRSEATAMALLNAPQESAMLAELDGTILASNIMGAKRLGATPEELVGKCVFDFFSPDVAKRRRQGATHILSQGKPFYFQDERDGIFFETSLYPVVDEESGYIRVAVFSRDISERKQAEQALRRSEATIRALINAPNETAMLIKPDGEVLASNEMGAERIGKTPEEIIGKCIYDFFPEDVAKLRHKYIKQAARTGKPVYFQDRRDGRYYDTSLYPIYGESGEENLVAVFGRDVTERIQAEEAYRSLAENSLQGLAVYQDGRVVYANKTFEKITGYPLDEVYAADAKAIAEVIHPEDRQKVMGNMADRINGVEVDKNYEYRIIRKNGRIRWVEIFSALSTYKGRPSVQVTYFDVTERKEMENALIESKRQFEMISNNINEAIWVFDIAEQRISFITSSVERITGFTAQEVTSYTLDKLYPPEAVKKIGDYIAEGLIEAESKKDISRQIELQAYHKNGSMLWIDVSARLIRDKNGAPKEILGITRDISNRKQAKEALRESEEKYRSLVEGSLQGVVIAQNDPLRLSFANSAMTTLTGFETEELCAMNPKQLANLIHADDRSRFFANFQQRLDGNNPTPRNEYRVITKSGDVVWVHSFSSRIDYLGSPATLTTYIDITEQKLAEGELRFQAMLLNQIQDLITATDLDGNITYVNEAECRLFGCRAEDLLGKNVAQYGDDPGTGATQKEILERTYAEGSWRGEIVNRTGDGRSVILDSRTQLLRDDDGLPVGMVGVSTDITDRRRAQSMIQVRANLLEFATKHSLDELLQETLNEVCELIDSPVGFYHFVHPDQKTLTLQAWSKKTLSDFCKAEGKGSHYGIDEAGVWVDCVHRRRPVIHNDYAALPHKKGMPEGHPKVIREMLVPIMREDKIVAILGVGNKAEDYTDKDVEIVAYLADVAWEIAEYKRSEEEKDNLSEQLRQSQKMEAIGRLAGGIAHDFNNILTGINGYAEMIINGLETGDPLLSDMEVIRNAGERAADLTSQLLAFSRKQVIAPKIINPNEILERSRKMLERIIGEDIELEYITRRETGRIKADPAQLDQVLVNLVVNARDAMPKGGKLTIETQNITMKDRYSAPHADMKPGDYVMLAVTDTGHGMDSETKSKIFEPFFSTKGKDQGTGLGLATVYGIVKQNGGFINVFSQPGMGTAFKVYLPRVQQEADSLSEDVAPALPKGRETILVVEDEDVVRQLSKRILERQGYKTIVAENGGEAFLKSRNFDGEIHLLLTDIIMPNMNGRQLYDELIKTRPRLKALFMSGYTEDVIAHHGVLEPGTQFIQKPFTIEKLAHTVRRVLDT